MCENAPRSNTLFGFFGDSPVTTMIGVFAPGEGVTREASMQNIETGIMAGVNVVNYMFGPNVLCHSTCKPAFIAGSKVRCHAHFVYSLRWRAACTMRALGVSERV